jgi:hypothetical protein
MSFPAGTISRVFLTVLLFSALAVVAGCTTMQRDIDANEESVTQLTGQNAALANRIDALESRMDIAESTVDALDESVTGESGIARACENCKDQSALIEQLARTQSFAYKKKQLLLKVKVLAGDADLPKARRTAKKLEKNGYSVRVVDFTPEPKFKRITLYYATGFRDEAKLMAKVLGKNTVLRPLTWNSVFDIIVVTAGK